VSDVTASGNSGGGDVKTILSIDGGGIRGLIPAVVLAEIEKRTGRQIADLFELIAGTSTGGIIAVGLTVPDQNGRPKFRATDVVDLYMNNGDKIFHHDWWRQTWSWLSGAAYSPAELERLLKAFAGEAMLSQAVTGLLVTTWELESRTAWFFRRALAKEDAGVDHPLWKIARATSAAPTYFPPLHLKDVKSGKDCALVDGGVFANNPGMAAWVDSHEGAAPGQKVFMLSLGTGSTDDPITYRTALGWGKIRCAQPILGVVLDGASDTVEHELSQLMTVTGNTYHRFQLDIPVANRRMDDGSKPNVQALKELAEKMIAERSKEIDQIGDELLALANLPRTSNAPAQP
jgi:patatin-like phospholipase/acyl hydrolase